MSVHDFKILMLVHPHPLKAVVKSLHVIGNGLQSIVLQILEL